MTKREKEKKEEKEERNQGRDKESKRVSAWGITGGFGAVFSAKLMFLSLL